MNDEINHAEYFFKPGVSPTSVNQFFDKPAEFWRYSSLNPNKERKEATPEMIFGRLVHCLILTPEAYDREFAPEPVKPDGALETINDMKAHLDKLGVIYKKSGSKAEFIGACREVSPGAPIWEDIMSAFYRGLEGKRLTVITQEQLAQAKSMQEAMFRNAAVKQLIGNGHSEEPFCWFPDGPNGLMRKCRLDYNRQGLVIEYKTDAEPDEARFERTIADRGYHRQLAMQVDASTRRYGEAPRGGIIIAQDKEYHDDIAIRAVKPAALTVGAEEVEYAFQQIAERLKTGNWKKFPEKIEPIGLPGYYRPKHLPRT